MINTNVGFSSTKAGSQAVSKTGWQQVTGNSKANAWSISDYKSLFSLSVRFPTKSPVQL